MLDPSDYPFLGSDPDLYATNAAARLGQAFFQFAETRTEVGRFQAIQLLDQTEDTHLELLAEFLEQALGRIKPQAEALSEYFNGTPTMPTEGR